MDDYRSHLKPWVFVVFAIFVGLFFAGIGYGIYRFGQWLFPGK